MEAVKRGMSFSYPSYYTFLPLKHGYVAESRVQLTVIKARALLA